MELWQGGQHGVGGNTADDLEPVGPVENESQPASRHLFVPLHQLDQGFGVDAGRQTGRQVIGRHHFVVVCDPLVAHPAQVAGQPGGKHEAYGYRLPVAQVVVADSFEGVGQRMAVVE